MIGDIMTISRLRMGTDGEGISSLVTFFDCPLHCKYCANDFCHEDADIWSESVPRASYTPELLVEKLKIDEPYYLMTRGGVVFGGGEPLLQSAFIHEVCKLANPNWKRRIETSLAVPWRYIEPVLNDFDEWIIDIKTMDPWIYKKYTGSSYSNMFENLYRLKDLVDHSRIHIRIPSIPGFTKKEDIEESTETIRDWFPDVKPELFEYMVLPRTKIDWCSSFLDDDDEADEE